VLNQYPLSKIIKDHAKYPEVVVNSHPKDPIELVQPEIQGK